MRERPPCFRKERIRGNMLTCKHCHFKNECISDDLSINMVFEPNKNNTGEIEIEIRLLNGAVGSVLFYVDINKIVVTDFGINDDYQRQGYGRLLMRIVQAFAEFKKLPIVLFSERTAIDFYKKCGFYLANTKPDRFGNRDMYWIPSNSKKKWTEKELFIQL